MTADESNRRRVADVPVPDFDSTPCTEAPPLPAAKVAIVTTAGLRPSGDVTIWPTDDPSFTILPARSRDLQLSHISPNFDRSGFAADIDVVFPIDRLDEMQRRGEIGAVADRHVSFMGAVSDGLYSTIMLDSGPAAAKVLLDQGVSVVLLTPV